MVVVFQILKPHDVWLWSYYINSNILAVLRHWIPRSTNRHTIAMAEKANCNEKSWESVSLMIMIIMVVNLKEQVMFTKRFESTLHCELTNRAGMHKLWVCMKRACMNSELAVSTVCVYC